MDWSDLLSSKRIGTATNKPSAQNLSRSDFERDFDRIIFSHPFRRMQDKTQVHPLPEHDFVHNRLTHSLEVSSVARSLGKKVGATIISNNSHLKAYSASDFGAIVAAAALAHDLGNPPFGHSGERCISEFFSKDEQGKSFKSMLNKEQWQDMIRFEGNAQGFRILNKEQYQGLKLTYSTLGTFTKYPCSSGASNLKKDQSSQKKYGFFQTEKFLFQEVANTLKLKKKHKNVWARHPLAFLVEAADDICYNIIDLEDGCRLGLVSLTDTIELLTNILGKHARMDKLNKIQSNDEKIGMLRALTVNQLVQECSSVFLKHEKEILNSTFDRTLVDCCLSAKALKAIKEISIEKIYRAQHILKIEIAGYTALNGLLQEFTLAGQQYLKGDLSGKQKTLIELLPPETRIEIDKNLGSPYHMLRSVIDFISGMTDNHALSLYRTLKAYPSLSGNLTG